MKDSRWSHVICEECWFNREGDRVPVQVNVGEPETCCFCGGETAAGIYIREHIEEAMCCPYEEAGRVTR